MDKRFKFPISRNELNKHATTKIELIINKFSSNEIDADTLCIEIKRLIQGIETDKEKMLKTIADLLYSSGNYTHSASIYLELLTLEPMNSQAYRFLGIIHQTNGSIYEAQIAHKKSILCASKNNPIYWDGINKCTNLLITANGVGEAVLASRQVGYLRQYANKVGIITRAPIQPLAELSRQFDFIVTSDQPVNSAEVFAAKHTNKDIKVIRQESTMSITDNPLFHSHWDEIMLFPDEEKILYWKEQFKRDTRYNNQDLVGLCWNTKQISPMHPNRSFKLEELNILNSDPSILLASFQNGYGSEQLDNCSFKGKFINMQDELSDKRDFSNTIASMKLCKYFITCDTGIAQVSCSLGINTVVITNDRPSAPWAGHGERSYFYKNAFIHRKEKQQGWEQAITNLFKHKLLSEIFN